MGGESLGWVFPQVSVIFKHRIIKTGSLGRWAGAILSEEEPQPRDDRKSDNPFQDSHVYLYNH